MKFIRTILNMVLIFLLASCSFTKFSLDNRNKIAQYVAMEGDLSNMIFNTEKFQIATYYRLDKENDDINIYIEGDGFAYVNKGQVSSNPTPTDPIALRLAAKDKNNNVVYIARPCQYVASDNCSKKYWTRARFSQDIINSVNEVIEYFVNRTRKSNINLIGFSGGGAVATLIATIRDDVKSLRTVAGNLNHKMHSQIHGVSDLDESLNPFDYALKISNLPQYHFIGEEDKNIIPEISLSFANRVEIGNKCVRISKVKGVGHENGWSDKWQYLLSKDIACKN